MLKYRQQTVFQMFKQKLKLIKWLFQMAELQKKRLLTERRQVLDKQTKHDGNRERHSP